MAIPEFTAEALLGATQARYRSAARLPGARLGAVAAAFRAGRDCLRACRAECAYDDPFCSENCRCTCSGQLGKTCFLR